MKTSRTMTIWLVLTLCAVMVLAAMTWMTRGVLASDREKAEAEARADLEECTRLALWRMDAAGAAVVSIENTQPAGAYQADANVFSANADAVVKLHFELLENGDLFSPDMKDSSDLTKLRELLDDNTMSGDEWLILKNAVEKSDAVWKSVSDSAPAKEEMNLSERESESRQTIRSKLEYQTNFNDVEKTKRARSVNRAVANAQAASLQSSDSQAAVPLSKKSIDAVGVTDAASPLVRKIDSGQLDRDVSFITELGAMRAIWIGDELFLLRQITSFVSGEKSKGVQGVWLDHQILSDRLLTEVRDLLPQAELVKAVDAASDPLALVSFPFRLLQNESPVVVQASLNTPLLVGWIAVLLALITAAALVYGVMRLSERRASFVSAVTHELRTPLTTFRLYADMLERGAVKEEKRAKYLQVLTREADRLSHLVENVLSFSQIERGSARSVVGVLSTSDLLGSVRDRLEQRLASAGLSLDLDTSESYMIRVDSALVEHVLFNLIDNAAKYATGSDPAVVQIKVSSQAQFVTLKVQDYGAGIPRSERARIFRAFHKSAHEAAETCPGVGLGLALSRRLAKSIGGQLVYNQTGKGACFVLKLPKTD
ncbi:MAG: sensor histidine kinase [Akkermansiaceae bacterium]